MKKVLIGLLMVIPLLIVGAVLLITEVILLTPDIAVTGIEIVDEYQVVVSDVEVENFVSGTQCEPQLYARVYPLKAKNKDVIWTIENVTYFNADFKGEIAKVEGGVVTVYSSGSFDVVATTDDGGFKARCSYLVKSDVATSGYIVYNGQKTDELNQTVTTTTDKTLKLDSCARPTDVDIELLEWKVVSGEDVVRVDANGIVVPKKAGTAVVKMSIKSYDKKDAGGKVTKAAEILTDEVTIVVTDGQFKVPYKYTTEKSFSLAELGAEGASLIEHSDNCTISGGAVNFNVGLSSNGFAVLKKGESTITVWKFAVGDVYFDNFEALKKCTADRAIITGKIPFFLNCIDAATENPINGTAIYRYSDASIAKVDEDGRIIPLKDKSGNYNEGEITFTATYGKGSSSITLNVKKPVIYFKLAPDEYSGIARERIFGTKWYTDKMDIKYDREKLLIIQPANIDNTRFTWTCDNNDVCSIDENGVITMVDFEGERVIKVTITAKESPYTIDSINSVYTFTVRRGMNVTNSAELSATVNGQTEDIFLQKNITFYDTNTGWHIRLHRNMYGNGHMINWRNSDGDAKASVVGADILNVIGENVLVRNVRIQACMPPADGSFSSKSFNGVCLRTEGGNSLIQYCQLEYGKNCIEVANSETTLDGSVLSNSSKFSLFSWCTRLNHHSTVKNCIFGISAAPSIGYSSGNQPNENSAVIDLEGFVYIYNWQQTVNMDLIGEIEKGNDALNGAIKALVNNELQSSKYDKYILIQNGVKYFHLGMLFSGLKFKCNVTINGVEERGFKNLEVNLNEMLGIAASDKDSFNNCYIWSYGKEGPVMPGDTYSLTDDTCKKLREGLNETKQ